MAGISPCEFLTAISLRGVDCGDYIKQGQMLSGRAFRDQPLSKPPLTAILNMIYKVAKVSLDNYTYNAFNYRAHHCQRFDNISFTANSKRDDDRGIRQSQLFRCRSRCSRCDH